MDGINQDISQQGVAVMILDTTFHIPQPARIKPPLWLSLFFLLFINLKERKELTNGYLQTYSCCN
jgi:hypothetical protein